MKIKRIFALILTAIAILGLSLPVSANTPRVFTQADYPTSWTFADGRTIETFFDERGNFVGRQDNGIIVRLVGRSVVHLPNSYNGGLINEASIRNGRVSGGAQPLANVPALPVNPPAPQVVQPSQSPTLTPPVDIGFDFRGLEAAGYSYEEIQSMFEAEVVRLVNGIRAEHGLPSLIHNPELARIARMRTEEIIEHRVRGHVSPVNGLEGTDYARAMGVSTPFAGEAIAFGQLTPQAAVNGWMVSTAGHREFVLSGSTDNGFTGELRYIGVGFSYGDSDLTFSDGTSPLGRTAWTLWQMKP